MKNKRSIKISEDFYKFLEKLSTNRVKLDSDTKTLSLCYLPDTIVNYFKNNNDRYLELCKMEVSNGTN